MMSVTDAASGTAAAAPRAARPGELCSRGYTEYYWTLDDAFSGNETYMVLCRPDGCLPCEGGWKPISVTMYMYWEDPNSCALTVHAEIRSAEQRGAGEPVCGELLTETQPTVVGPFSPPGLWAVTVPLPEDSPLIVGPCFASLSFLDTCDERPALVATPTACERMTTWVKNGSDWVDLASMDFPGNLALNASFECQLSDTEKPVAWSTVKDIYAD